MTLLLVEVDSGDVLDRIEVSDGEVAYETGVAGPKVQAHANRMGISEAAAVEALKGHTNGYIKFSEPSDDEAMADPAKTRSHSMSTKSFRPTFKNVGDKGEVTFVVATLNEVDKDGDVTLPGFFGQQHVTMVPVHDWNHVPIGKGQIYEEGNEVLCKAKLNLNIPSAKDWYEAIKFDFENPPAIQEYCADEETEVLTQRGWLRFDQLTTEDQAYTLDAETGTAKFEDVLAVNIFPRQERKLRLVETGGFSALTTAAHRWPVRFVDGRLGWRTTETLAACNGFLRTAPRVDAPTETKWSDAFVELVAWFWNEGNHERNNICIGQSTKVNPHKVAAIRAALSAAFPGQWSERTDADGMTRFRLFVEAARTLKAVVGNNKAPRPDFLLALTMAQLRLFIERCLDGDGTRHASGTRLWYQSDPDSISTFEMVCALAGEPTASHCDMKVNESRHGLRPRRTVSLLRSPTAVPLAAVKAKTYNDKPRRTSATDEWIPYDGHVWCPTTPSGTWLARRRGSVYFTGNSYGFDVLDGGQKRGMHKGYQVRFLKPKDDGQPGVKVHEVSPVLVGAGSNTRTLAVKGRSSMRINRASGATTSTVARAVKGAIPSHETKTASRPWDNVKTVKALPDDSLPSELRTVFAWVDPDGDPEELTSYKCAHHHGLGGPANLRACLIGIAELNQGTTDIPDADRKGVYDHLAAHIRDADRDPPELRTKGSGPGKQYDQLLEGLATLSGLIDGVYSGAARQEKGRGLSKVKSELLGWIGDDLTRLKALLSQPAEPEVVQPSDDELASLAAASLARINGF